MKSETFELATELQKKINEAEKTLEQWQTAKEFCNSEINVWRENGRGIYSIQSVPGTFEILKALSIQRLMDRLKELKSQFDEL